MNKNIIKTLLATFILFIGMNIVNAQEKLPKKIEKTFTTSAECGDCKDRIEGKLNYTKGVIFAELDVATKKLTVKWKTKTISEDEIKQIVANTGYDIDDVPANAESVEKLPACCKPNGH